MLLTLLSHSLCLSLSPSLLNQHHFPLAKNLLLYMIYNDNESPNVILQYLYIASHREIQSALCMHFGLFPSLLFLD